MFHSRENCSKWECNSLAGCSLWRCGHYHLWRVFVFECFLINFFIHVIPVMFVMWAPIVVVIRIPLYFFPQEMPIKTRPHRPEVFLLLEQPMMSWSFKVKMFRTFTSRYAHIFILSYLRSICSDNLAWLKSGNPAYIKQAQFIMHFSLDLFN